MYYYDKMKFMEKNKCERCMFFVQHYGYNVKTCGATEVMRRDCEKQYFEHMKDTFDWCDR